MHTSSCKRFKPNSDEPETVPVQPYDKRNGNNNVPTRLSGTASNDEDEYEDGGDLDKIPRTPNGFSLIGTDVLSLISDCTGNPNLNLTSRRAWNRLGRRHTHYDVTDHNVSEVLDVLETSQLFMTIVIRQFTPLIQSELPRLRASESLRNLTIIFSPEDYGFPALINAYDFLYDWRMMDALVIPLRTAPALRVLHLDFSHPSNQMSPEGANALATLKEAPKLEELYLKIGRFNGAHYPGIIALCKLKDMPNLQVLHIDMYRAAPYFMTHHSAALSGFKEAPKLRVLRLNLGGIALRHPGIFVDLAKLNESSSLQTLELNLSDCKIKDKGICELAKLSESPSLKTLNLTLTRNKFLNMGAECLFGLLLAHQQGHILARGTLLLDFEEKLPVGQHIWTENVGYIWMPLDRDVSYRGWLDAQGKQAFRAWNDGPYPSTTFNCHTTG
jgi:hypothetical protein